MSKIQPIERAVIINRSGKEYKGSFQIERGMITVFYKFDKKTTQLGGHAGAEESLARILLGELVDQDQT